MLVNQVCVCVCARVEGRGERERLLNKRGRLDRSQRSPPSSPMFPCSFHQDAAPLPVYFACGRAPSLFASKATSLPPLIAQGGSKEIRKRAIDRTDGDGPPFEVEA